MTTTESFWYNKRVFVTQPASFLGAWVVKALLAQKAQVFGFGEAPATETNLFDLENLGQKISMTFGDLRDEAALREALSFAQADAVIHLGEIGLLQDAQARALETFSKSAIGTATLMELMRETASVRSVVVLSSDKVYARKTSQEAYTEEDSVGASAALPTAKLCSELIALSYRQTFFAPEKYNKHKVAIATARMGSAVGGGDFTEQALIPQAVKAFVSGEVFTLKNPQSLRPWIAVQDQVLGLLALAHGLIEKGPKLAASYNFGPSEMHAVGEVARILADEWGAKAQLSWNEEIKSNISRHGELNSHLAKQDLGWEPRRNLQNTLKETIQWYKEYYSSATSAKL